MHYLKYGLSNQEIAQAMGIGYETVKEYVQIILRKLEMQNRVQVAVWATRRERDIQDKKQLPISPTNIASHSHDSHIHVEFSSSFSLPVERRNRFVETESFP